MSTRKVAASAVWFELPFCLYVDDGLYELKMGDKIGAISMRRRARYSRVEDLPFSRSGIVLGIDPSNCEIQGDRFGLVAYSETIVNMPEDLLNVEGDILHNTLKERTVDYTNRLIEVYRVVTGEYWVQPLSTADLVTIMPRFMGEDGRELPDIAYEVPRQIASGSAIKRTDDIHRRIRELLSQGTEIPVYTRLMLDSLSSIRFGRSPLAVIEAQTAFENFFYTYVTYELGRRRLLSPTLQAELDKPGFRAKVSRSIAGRRDVDKLEYFSSLITTPPRAFAKGVPEHDDWYRLASLLRNEVIHKGKYNVTRQEAEDAFKAVEGSFGFFNQEWRGITFR